MNYNIKDINAIDFTQLQKNDCLKILEFRNHPEISKWMYTKNISLSSHLKFIAGLKKTSKSYYWLFKKNQIELGVGSITRINPLHKHAFLGLYKNPNLTGVGKEILKSLEYIAFKEFSLHTLHLEVMKNNQKAIDFYQKYDYNYSGELLDFIYQEGVYENVLIYTKRNPND
ncbi:UDP-4-amino-4,6-dideoxy-N-acetyl-beta-L-altrosamine N-acetyltransferase [Helicobacter sp. 13S00477-4]|uniref:UDP-4-amino-4, 6-dideoxy-N-acetyl-beta-L-altrosamine N-acetyltransferase n=1 Tax=Helicobacter sp. 13S00477-4 TaxID=1905759 RepID=UPI000BA6A9EF|nr:UDP-4-amino-4,6-dideoxy-N-acetyl-beta-L-altrosamine N-acetyltransferase [Helicobacter sp. 13S00477-4]PAF52161.1 UDP-4-amino-4,6-dideoxy-N-acetyl-beta-L-altrosamine N-acetyltransferase [Helicobacter sp. 13S00477-4]